MLISTETIYKLVTCTSEFMFLNLNYIYIATHLYVPCWCWHIAPWWIEVQVCFPFYYEAYTNMLHGRVCEPNSILSWDERCMYVVYSGSVRSHLCTRIFYILYIHTGDVHLTPFYDVYECAKKIKAYVEELNKVLYWTTLTLALHTFEQCCNIVLFNLNILMTVCLLVDMV